MLTLEEKKALLELIARVTGGVKDLAFLILLASAARKIGAMETEEVKSAETPE